MYLLWLKWFCAKPWQNILGFVTMRCHWINLYNVFKGFYLTLRWVQFHKWIIKDFYAVVKQNDTNFMVRFRKALNHGEDKSNRTFNINPYSAPNPPQSRKSHCFITITTRQSNQQAIWQDREREKAERCKLQQQTQRWRLDDVVLHHSLRKRIPCTLSPKPPDISTECKHEQHYNTIKC